MSCLSFVDCIMEGVTICKALAATAAEVDTLAVLILWLWFSLCIGHVVGVIRVDHNCFVLF